MDRKDVEGKGPKVSEIISRHLSANTEENHETSRSEEQVSGLTFELVTCRV
jgi:hypothetical protein